MMKTLLLTKLELYSLWGFNEFLHSSDEKARRNQAMLYLIFGLLFLVFSLYMAGQTFLLVRMGLGDLVPAVFTMAASCLVFFLTVYSGTLFSQQGYDILFSLPLPRWAIGLARILRMYLVSLLLTFFLTLPGVLMYLILAKPAGSFLPLFCGGCLVLPMIPLAAACLMNAGIAALAAGRSHRFGIETALRTLLLLACLVLPLAGSGISGQIMKNPQALSALLGDLMAHQYPPALWLGKAAVQGNIRSFLLFLGASLGIFLAVCCIILRNYAFICQRLFTITRKNIRSRQKVESSPLLCALYRKEAKLYFSSSIYVSNTIVGPILATFCAVAVVFMNTGVLHVEIPETLGQMMLPIWAAICCLMCPTACSVSMEGSRVWIPKSLPISRRDFVHGKLLWGLSVMMPFCLLSQIVLLIGFSRNFWDGLWILIYPPFMLVFACVFGLFSNLRFQNFSWKKPEQVVKQSASSMLGGMIPSLISLLLGGILLIIPYGQPLVLLILGAGIWLLYKKCLRFSLGDV